MGRLTKKYGQLLLSQLFTQVWYGNWKEFEETINHLPKELQNQFPFYEVYDREQTRIWHNHYFNTPGKSFIPPYLSSYQEESLKARNAIKKDLQVLFETFDKLGLHYSLDERDVSDHIGSFTALITVTISLEIKAMQQKDVILVEDLQEAKGEMCEKYLKPGIDKLWETYKHKIKDPFFETFIPYFISNIGFISNIKTSTGGRS